MYSFNYERMTTYERESFHYILFSRNIIIEWFSSALKEFLHAENNEVSHFVGRSGISQLGPQKG